MHSEAKIAAALADLRADLIEGGDPHDAVMIASLDHDLPPNLLRNRAMKAFGDLGTLAARTAETKAVAAAQQTALEARRDAAEARAQETLREFADALRATGSFEGALRLVGAR